MFVTNVLEVLSIIAAINLGQAPPATLPLIPQPTMVVETVQNEINYNTKTTAVKEEDFINETIETEAEPEIKEEQEDSIIEPISTVEEEYDIHYNPYCECDVYKEEIDENDVPVYYCVEGSSPVIGSGEYIVVIDATPVPIEEEEEEFIPIYSPDISAPPHAEDEVIGLAGSEEEAKKIAEENDLILKDYNNGVAVFDTNGQNPTDVVENSDGNLELNEIISLNPPYVPNLEENIWEFPEDIIEP